MGKIREKFWKMFNGGGGGSTSLRSTETPSTASVNNIKTSSNPTEPYQVVSSDLSVNQVKISPSSAEPQHIVSSIPQPISDEPSGCDMELHIKPSVPQGIDPPAEVDLESDECQLMTKFTEQQTPELSTSQRLWNAAYDNLATEKDTARLAESYVKTLAKVLMAQRAPDVEAELNDPTKRQEYMKKLVDEGRKKVAISSKIVQTAGDVAEFVLSAKGMVDAAIQNIPQAALPWAGVCIGLQILLNPAKAKKSNLAGIVHVTSQMEWYCALAEHLLNKENIRNEFSAVANILEEKIIALYKALMLYQMKSICSYYRNQGIDFLRGLMNLDDWDGDLKSVKLAEAVVEDMSIQYHREYEKSALSKLVYSGRAIETRLGDIHLDLRDFITQQKERQMDAEVTECLRDLFAGDPQDDMKSIERKKDGLLNDSFKWILSTEQFEAFTNWGNDEPTLPPCRLLWIKGPAGTGKTMLLIGIIRELTTHSAALAPSVSHFFCQGTDNSRNSPTAVLRSLLWLLLLQQPHLITHLQAKYKYSGRSLFTDSNTYVALFDVFKRMLEDPSLSRAYLIVDALDECSQGRGSADIIELISTSLSACNKVKWLVASRPEVELNRQEIAGALVELDAQSLKDPVNIYIEYKLSILQKRRDYSGVILDQISRKIRQRAANIFLWVALVFKQLDQVKGWNAVKTIEEMPPGLAELYSHIMIKIGKLDDMEYCKDALVAAALAYRPLSLLELSVLVGLPENVDMQTIVEECGSFLTIREETVYLIHQSAKDYLDKEFQLQQDGAAPRHMDMFRRSIEAMSKLQRNIYGLTDFGVIPEALQPPDPDPLAPMQYSCLFWADHLCDAHSGSFQHENGRADIEAIWLFLKDHLLHWLESLSLLGRLPDGMRSIKRILQDLPSGLSLQLFKFLKDAEKFLLSYGSIIGRAPLQIYGSALVFSPKLSEIKQQLWRERLPFIEGIKGIRGQDMCLQTLEGHTKGVHSITFSPDGKTLASNSSDGTVRLWDAGTGTHQQTLTLESKTTWGVSVFSADGKKLVLASADKTITLWDATGACLQTLKCHNSLDDGDDDSIHAIALSPDGKKAAFALKKAIQLWDVTGEYQQTLEYDCYDVTFSLDGGLLTSISKDRKMVRLWDVKTGACKQSFWRHGNILENLSSDMSSIDMSSAVPIRAIAFSPDGKILAASSEDYMCLWDIVRGAPHETVNGFRRPDFRIPRFGRHRISSSLAFSPNGRTLASGLDIGSSIWLWDAITGTHLKTLEGNVNLVTTLEFSPDGKMLASACSTTIRLWDTTMDVDQQTLNGESYVHQVIFSPDGKMLVTSSRGSKEICLWDVATGIQRCILDDTRYAMAIAFSPDSKTIAIGGGYNTSLWDVATGTRRLTLESDGKAIAFSPDGKTLASGSEKNIQLWDATTGIQRLALEGDDPAYPPIAFSPDGKMLAFASSYGKIQIWDSATGAHLHTLGGNGNNITGIAFFPDRKTLASVEGEWYQYQSIRLWDVETGAQQRILEGYHDLHGPMTVSTDGRFLMTRCGSVRISSQANAHSHHGPSDNALFIHKEWITRDKKPILWLPTEYRNRFIEGASVYGGTVALGHERGATFLCFNF